MTERMVLVNEARLYEGMDMDGPEELPVAGGAAVVYSAQCPGKTTGNEDAAAVVALDSGVVVLVVADGVGGERGGGLAAGLAIRSLKASLAAVGREGDWLRAAILDGIESANRAVQDLGVGAGTTLTVVELEGGVIRPYHVGDSMILVVGQRGKIKLQTVSHSPVGFAVEAGFLDEDEAMHHDQRHVVSNMVGAVDMRIEVGSAMRLHPRDTLLLASDGVFDNLHMDEIIECIRKGPLGKAAARLASDSHTRMTSPAGGEPSKPDDLTLVAYRPAM